MSTSTPQTRTKKDRLPFLIAFAAAFALLASFLMGWLTPAHPSAALSNGGFCIGSTYDSDPEIKGVAGGEHCGAPSATPTAEPELMTKYYSETVKVSISLNYIRLANRVKITRIIDGERTVVFDQTGAGSGPLGNRRDYTFDDWTSFEQPTPVSQYAPTYEVSVAVPGVGTFTKTVDLHTDTRSSSASGVVRYIYLTLNGPDLWVDTSKG